MNLNFDLAPWQAAAVYSPIAHLAFYGGVGVGKSFSGSHYAIEMMTQYPHLTGFIGANTYDQMTQATLFELFYWLDHYGLPYVIDQKPPPHWGAHRKKFKTYKNILSVLVGGKIVNCFTRVLGEGNPLRGIEFSWYWLDETRDTPQNTHDIILSRMRESNTFARGLITTTTNGEDWSHERFVRGADGKLYGSMHIPTTLSVDYGINSKAYLDTMLRSYSPLMAQQEIYAQHVNVLGGRAYYAGSEKNRKRVAPWGDAYPNPERPLILGCDFNFSPAPCVWMIGQVGPSLYDAWGRPFWEQIHWFGEVSDVGVGTAEMTDKVIGRYPGFQFQVFGDKSGDIGTTSNAGETDYNQMNEVFSERGVIASIWYDQTDAKERKANPKVRSRVENMNAMLCNALGEVRQTYNPEACPLFDDDIKNVGWKPTTASGRGKLDDGGKKTRTHATDGAGYAVYKLFPPGRRAVIVGGQESANLAPLKSVLGGAAQ